jgi:uncharacterized membrane protein
MTEAETPSTPPPPPPAPPASSESGNRGIMIVLSYLWILALIPLLVEKDDAEVQWHAKHGVVLLVAEILFWIVVAILTSIPVLGCIIAPLALLLSVAVLVVHIICIVKGINGERFLIPGVSQYADKLNF